MDRVRPSPWRRLIAYGIDYVVIAAYIALLFGAVVIVRRMIGSDSPAALSPLIGQSIGFVTLTLPVVLYFAIMEASAGGGTIGKRALGVRVVKAEGGQARFSQTIVRAVVKLCRGNSRTPPCGACPAGQ